MSSRNDEHYIDRFGEIKPRAKRTVAKAPSSHGRSISRLFLALFAVVLLLVMGGYVIAGQETMKKLEQVVVAELSMFWSNIRTFLSSQAQQQVVFPTATIATRHKPVLPTSTPRSTSTPWSSPTPTLGPTIYVVRPGDTLSGIAKQHGVPIETLIKANDIANPNLIIVGQKLLIPQSE
jgi:LysM repeat protein